MLVFGNMVTNTIYPANLQAQAAAAALAAVAAGAREEGAQPGAGSTTASAGEAGAAELGAGVAAPAGQPSGGSDAPVRTLMRNPRTHLACGCHALSSLPFQATSP